MITLQLIEYNDTDDAADLTHYTMRNSTATMYRSFNKFEWMNVTMLDGDTNGFVFNSTMWPMMDNVTDMLQKDIARNYTPSLSFTVSIYMEYAKTSWNNINAPKLHNR